VADLIYVGLIALCVLIARALVHFCDRIVTRDT